MALRNKLATTLMCAGGLVTLLGSGMAACNGYKYNESRNEAIARITGQDRKGVVLIDNKGTYDLSKSTNPRTNAEINAAQIEYRDDALFGLGMVFTGLITMGLGSFARHYSIGAEDTEKKE